MCDVWPNFFIVGAAKAGTTSLHRYLEQHPQVLMSSVKEPRFFEAGYEKVISGGKTEKRRWTMPMPITEERKYLQLFKGAGEAKAIGETSPSYLWDEEAPYLIKEKVPEAKIIISLRDPIERAYSQYLHHVRMGIEIQPFYEALFDELNFYYVEPGRYSGQVKRYLEVFEKDQVLVIMYEDLKRNPVELLRRVADFLGVDREPVKHISMDTTYNPYRAPKNRLVQLILSKTIWLRFVWRHTIKRITPLGLRSYINRTFFYKRATKPPIDRKAVEYLKTIYEEEIVELEELLGLPLPDLRKAW
jgi:hypothetical protein